MCSLAPTDSRAFRFGSDRSWATVEIVLIFAIFFIHGAWPAPDSNEPHYLSKAKHYWDAGWCAQDFFCNTADAHQVFYWTFGWLSLWLPLSALAWCGRLLTWGLLAYCWRRLSVALVPARLYAVLSAALVLTLLERSAMAGEWIIGGLEAKGFAYALVLLGLETLTRGIWNRAILLFGAASAFHVLVGGWAVVALAVVWLNSKDRPTLRQLVAPLVGGLLLALPGLVPALALTWRADPQLVDEANLIYVFQRLDHHLAAESFAPKLIVRHLLFVLALAILVRFAPGDERFRRLRGFVAAAVGIAAIGMMISALAPWSPDWAARLLRYYWFRMSDVMVPIGTALVLVAILFRFEQTIPKWHVWLLAGAMLAAGVPLAETVVRRHRHPWPPADAGVANLAAWREACQWAADETPPDAVFLTPRLAQTFRWYASRAEVVSRKDIPQDAKGIIEWWRRMLAIHCIDPGTEDARWRESLAELGAERLRELGREFGADYVITSAEPAVALERVGPLNPSYAIYRLTNQ